MSRDNRQIESEFTLLLQLLTQLWQWILLLEILNIELSDDLGRFQGERDLLQLSRSRKCAKRKVSADSLRIDGQFLVLEVGHDEAGKVRAHGDTFRKVDQRLILARQHFHALRLQLKLANNNKRNIIVLDYLFIHVGQSDVVVSEWSDKANLERRLHGRFVETRERLTSVGRFEF